MFYRDYDASEITVRCGEWNTANVTGDASLAPQNIKAKTVIIHPEFEKEVNYNDLAIIILEDSFDMTAGHISPVCLPKKDDVDIDMKNCFAFGWGRDRFGRKGEYATTLKHVKLNMVDFDSCQEKLRKTKLTRYFNLHESFTCAGGEEGIDLCTGDGGGPLVCARKSNPDQYVQVSSLVNCVCY